MKDGDPRYWKWTLQYGHTDVLIYEIDGHNCIDKKGGDVCEVHTKEYWNDTVNPDPEWYNLQDDNEVTLPRQIFDGTVDFGDVHAHSEPFTVSSHDIIIVSPRFIKEVEIWL